MKKTCHTHTYKAGEVNILDESEKLYKYIQKELSETESRKISGARSIHLH